MSSDEDWDRKNAKASATSSTGNTRGEDLKSIFLTPISQ